METGIPSGMDTLTGLAVSVYSTANAGLTASESTAAASRRRVVVVIGLVMAVIPKVVV
jgi:hypothetical protein